MNRTAPRLALPLVLALALASQSAGAQSAATAVVDRAIARMGGDAALRAIRTIRMDVITQWQRTVLTDHPFADAPSYERHADLRDYQARAWRNTRQFIPAGRTVDIVADTVGARTVQGPNGMPSTTPLNIAYVDERRELFAFAPERMLQLVRDAADLRALPDTTIAGVVHARVSATVEGFQSTLFLRRTDGLPALARFRANETNDFGLAPWGTMEVEFWYSAWSRVAPGVLLPRQRDVRRIGRPYKRMTVVAMTVNAPAPADSFAITETTARSYLANARRPMWDVAPDPALARLEAMRARAPRDAVVLYELAVLHAAAGRQHDALQLLDTVSRAPGALDPSFHRRFFPYHGDSEWQRTIERIRAANPPIVRSTPAFTITERDLHPEGIAFDSVSRSLFVGSFKGKIVRIDSAGRTTDFAFASRPESARVVVGVRVDAARRHLWAAVADPRAFGDTTIDGGGLEQFDIGTGRVIASHRGAKGAFNDVVIAPNGDAFATNTVDGSIWRVRGGAFSAFLPPGSVREANGIAVSPDGRWLFAAGWHDIIRIDVRTRAIRPLGAPDGVVTGSFDGLYWYDGGLVGIQNGIHPGRVVRLDLDATHARITSAQVLEQYHPQFNGMTTAALDGDTLLYLLNTQSRSFNPDGTVRPGAVLQDIIITRLPLRRR